MRVNSISICLIMLLCLCSCTKKPEIKIEFSDAIINNNHTFDVPLDTVCDRIKASNLIDKYLIGETNLDTLVLYELKHDVSFRVQGSENSVTYFSIDMPKTEEAGKVFSDVLGSAIISVQPSIFTNNQFETLVKKVSNPMFGEKNEEIPIYFDNLEIICDVFSSKISFRITAWGDRVPTSELLHGDMPSQPIQFKMKDKSYDTICKKAQKDSSFATIETVDYALKYIINNYNDFYDGTEAMERIIYYGEYLDEVCSNRNLTYQKIGVNSVNAVKNVYQKIETRNDHFSKTNYEQVLELIERIK